MEERGDIARCSVTDLLLLVTTVLSGSETRRAILSFGFHSVFLQGVLVSQKFGFRLRLQGKVAEGLHYFCKSLCPAAFPNRHELRQGSTAVKTLARIANPAIIITKDIGGAGAVAVRRALAHDQLKIHPCIFLEATGSPRSWRSHDTTHRGLYASGFGWLSDLTWLPLPSSSDRMARHCG